MYISGIATSHRDVAFLPQDHEAIRKAVADHARTLVAPRRVDPLAHPLTHQTTRHQAHSLRVPINTLMTIETQTDTITTTAAATTTTTTTPTTNVKQTTTPTTIIAITIIHRGTTIITATTPRQRQQLDIVEARVLFRTQTRSLIMN